MNITPITKEIMEEADALAVAQDDENEAIAKKYGYESHHEFWEAVFKYKQDNGYFNNPDHYPHWTDYAYKAAFYLLMPLQWVGNFKYWLMGPLGAAIRYFDPRIKKEQE